MRIMTIIPARSPSSTLISNDDRGLILKVPLANSPHPTLVASRTWHCSCLSYCSYHERVLLDIRRDPLRGDCEDVIFSGSLSAIFEFNGQRFFAGNSRISEQTTRRCIEAGDLASSYNT
jgi:hypothetical protein